MALLVEHPVDGFGSTACRVPLDPSRRAEVVGDEGAQVIGVAGGVCDDMVDAVESFEQAARLGTVAPVSGCDLEAQRQPESIDGGVDLGGQPASGPADCVSLRPPF